MPRRSLEPLSPARMASRDHETTSRSSSPEARRPQERAGAGRPAAAALAGAGPTAARWQQAARRLVTMAVSISQPTSGLGDNRSGAGGTGDAARPRGRRWSWCRDGLAPRAQQQRGLHRRRRIGAPSDLADAGSSCSSDGGDDASAAGSVAVPPQMHGPRPTRLSTRSSSRAAAEELCWAATSLAMACCKSAQGPASPRGPARGCFRGGHGWRGACVGG